MAAIKAQRHVDGDEKERPSRRIRAPEKLGAVPKVALTADEHAKNNLPDILARWRSFGVPTFGVPASAGKTSDSQRATRLSKPATQSHTPPPEGGTPNPELQRPRTAQSFCVPKADIAAKGYDLSLNQRPEVCGPPAWLS